MSYFDEMGGPRSIQDCITIKREVEETLRDMERSFNRGSVMDLRDRLDALRDEHPTIERFGFQAAWSYDDEGSHYWTAHPVVEPGEDDERWARRKSGYGDYEVSEYWDVTEDNSLWKVSIDTWAAAAGVEGGVEEGKTYWIGETENG